MQTFQVLIAPLNAIFAESFYYIIFPSKNKFRNRDLTALGEPLGSKKAPKVAGTFEK